MTEPPNKTKPAAAPPGPAAGSAAARARTQVAKPTLVEHLFANPQAIGDDEIKVWVRTHAPDRSDEFCDALYELMDQGGVIDECCELLEASETAPLRPGQHVLLFSALGAPVIRVNLIKVTVRRPDLVFRGVRFHVYTSRWEYAGLRLGDGRLFVTAANRALVERGGKDWFGGIAEFATRFLRRPRGWKPVLQ